MRYRHQPKEEAYIGIKDCLYTGLSKRNLPSIILVEGIFDMWRMGEGSACVFGTKVTPAQKLALSRYSRIKILFDGDDAGRKGAEKVADDLSAFTDVQIISLPDGIDPDKLNKEEIRYVKNL